MAKVNERELKPGIKFTSLIEGKVIVDQLNLPTN